MPEEYTLDTELSSIRAGKASNVKLGVAKGGREMCLILESDSTTTGETIALIREMPPLVAIALASAMISAAMAIIDVMSEEARAESIAAAAKESADHERKH